MTVDEVIAFIKDWAQRFEARLNELVNSLDVRVRGMQRDLVRRFVEIVNDLFDFEGGKLVNNQKNIKQLRRLELMFDGFSGATANYQLELFANELLEIGSMTAGYFEAVNPGGSREKIVEALNLMRAAIGIDEYGNLIVDGFLWRLGRSQAVRDEIRDYVVKSIVARKSLKQFVAGFKEIVEGANGLDGILQRYWRQYAYDAYNQGHEVVNSSAAESLGMKYFIYQGSIIPTTRAFCRHRAGNVYSVEETKLWKDDPDLIDKKTKDAYNPIIERGRYNCRHFLNWISRDIAVALRPDIK